MSNEDCVLNNVSLDSLKSSVKSFFKKNPTVLIVATGWRSLPV